MNWNDINENLNKEGYNDYTPSTAERIMDKRKKMTMDMKESFLTINELANENMNGYIDYMTKKENEMDNSNIAEPVEDTKTERQGNDNFRRDPVKNRFFKLLGVLFKIADISGFRILNRLEIQDKKTGRVFK